MRAAILAATVLCGMSGAALADTYAVQVGPARQNGDGIQYEVAFTDFDQTRGTLNSATLMLSGLFTASVTVAGSSGLPAVAQFGPSTLDFYNTRVGDYGTHTAPFIGNTAAASFSFSVNKAVPIGYVQGAASGSDTFYLHGGQAYTNSTTGLRSDTSRLSIASGSIVYDYTPFAVPEPATFALLGLGLVGAGAMRRRYSATR